MVKIISEGFTSKDINIHETDIKMPVDKQAIYRIQVIETTTTLTANSSFTSAGIDTTNYSNFQGFVYADQDGTLEIQVSADNSNWYPAQDISVTAGSTVTFDFTVVSAYTRVVYTNGATDQTAFRLDAYMVVK